MGLLWNLLQQSQISDANKQLGSQQGHLAHLEHRVRCLEAELVQTRHVLGQLIKWLENQHGRDIDGDGKVG
jgi:hypothetical protein